MLRIRSLLAAIRRLLDLLKAVFLFDLEPDVPAFIMWIIPTVVISTAVQLYAAYHRGFWFMAVVVVLFWFWGALMYLRLALHGFYSTNMFWLSRQFIDTMAFLFVLGVTVVLATIFLPELLLQLMDKKQMLLVNNQIAPIVFYTGALISLISIAVLFGWNMWKRKNYRSPYTSL